MRESLSRGPLLPLSATMVACLLLLAALPAAATDLLVDCGSGGSVQDAVNSLSGTPGPHTIHISGTCTENILIDRIDDLALAGNPTATIVSASEDLGAVIYFSRSERGEVRNLTVDANGQFATGIFAERAEVHVVGCTVTNSTDVGIIAFDQSRVDLGAGGGAPASTVVVVTGNAAGVWAFTDSNLIVSRVLIENNSEDGLVVQARSVAQIRGGLTGNIIRNNGFGVSVTNASEVTFAGNNLIQGNGPYGMLVTRNSQVNVNATVLSSTDKRFTIIEGHTQWGMLVGDSNVAFTSNSSEPLHLIRNNAVGATGMHGGIFQFRPSSLLLRQTAVLNNGGPGVHVLAGGYVALTDAAISGNGGDGLRLEHNSLAEFGGFYVTGESAPANTTITGNGAQDIFCDASSEVFGDLAAFRNVTCTQKRDRGAAPAAAASGFEQQFERRIDRRKSD